MTTVLQAHAGRDLPPTTSAAEWRYQAPYLAPFVVLAVTAPRDGLTTVRRAVAAGFGVPIPAGFGLGSDEAASYA